ncbi:MAG: hypothetical protein HY911_09570 [Desulfobacterales bacterium]|nr:hypothetical protein [Desulfobacterales bacterium]
MIHRKSPKAKRSALLILLLGLALNGLGCVSEDAGTVSSGGDSTIAPQLTGATAGSTLSSDGLNPHANLKYAEYPANCLACHPSAGREMLESNHYRWAGAAPDMVNAPHQLQGKLTNAVNSYCINILGNWPMCGACHVGRGASPDVAANDPTNVDCLVCHNPDYGQRRTRLPNGSMGVADPTDSLVRAIQRPSRASCLACHAKAGGGDAVKRGDLSLAVANNTDRNFDVHMNGAGANLNCQACHVFEAHKTIGKGSDLRATDDLARGSEVSCLTCHADKASREGHDTQKINDHVARVACQTCHVPIYAKVATETHRDWRRHADGSVANSSAKPGHPYTEKLANLIPDYRFWNRKSDNALLGDDASRTYNASIETWSTSRPMGNVSDGKLYPFKYKTAVQPKTVADDRLIALNTYEYLKATGDVGASTQQGLQAMGYSAAEPYEWVTTDTYQLLNHGVAPASGALSCKECHGSTTRMDLKGELGYQLKQAANTLCVQCHGRKESKPFEVIHAKHVKDKKYDCSRCHTFSRPERRLNS